MSYLMSLLQVITALSEKNRSHIPYRNSMMTSVLRDSLGGNCMTTMIAMVSVEKRNVDVMLYDLQTLLTAFISLLNLNVSLFVNTTMQ